MVRALVIGSAAAALVLAGVAAAVVNVRVPSAPPSSGGRMQINLTTPKPAVQPRGTKLETVPPQTGPMVSTAPITVARPAPPPRAEAAEASPFDERLEQDRADSRFDEEAFDRDAREDDRRAWREERERRAYERAERDAEDRAYRFRDDRDMSELPSAQWPRYERPRD